MARRIASRLKITGTLVAGGPLHVGGLDPNADVDLALATNGAGELYVPGTSIAGPIRAWLAQPLDDRKIGAAWGYQQQSDDKLESDGAASFIVVEDGPIKLPPGMKVETREGVGIDRLLGAAAEGVKYNRAVLPSGTEIALEMTVELGEQAANTQSQVAAAIKALQDGKIQFGAAKTRGLGKVTLNGLSIRRQELLTRKGMLDTLRDESTACELNDLDPMDFSGGPALDIEIQWAPRGPLMVKAEADGVAVDTLPLVSARDNELTFVLPGSSIKGALRSQAERIVRTVCGFSASPVTNSREAFMNQIEMRNSAATPQQTIDTLPSLLIGGIFGQRGRQMTKKEELSDDDSPLPGLSALRVADCYAKLGFTPKHWEAIETAPDTDAEGHLVQGAQSPLRKALQNAGLEKMQQAFHVAIDRWTGGAADGFLYTVLEPHGVEWEPMRLTLDLSRLLPRDRKPAVMCLLLTLRDLVSGRIPLGFGVNRGMGALEVTSIQIITTEVDGELVDLKDVKIVEAKLGGWSETVKDTLERSWTNWLETVSEEANKNGS
jgi:CRISPR/Cas system CSM-associated protein Csm3 (group 7 of RAMP superfamily)